MKNKIHLLVAFVTLSTSFIYAQVGIGTVTPDAALEITSTTNGLVIPRVALTSKAVSAPVVKPSGGAPLNSTMVFNTATTVLGTNDDVIPGFYYWDTTTTRWVYVGNDPKIASTTWNLLGNSGTNPATNFMGTTDNQNVVFKRNNIVAGLLAPTTTAFGTAAAVATTGINNAAFGANALNTATTATGNSAFGSNALRDITTATNNSAFGINALILNTATGNSAFGAFALDSNTSAVGNSAFGVNTLADNVTGANNSAFGADALFNNEVSGNSAFGFHALDDNTTGTGNNAFGENALGAVTGNGNNSAFGTSALLANTAAGNSAFGANALDANTSGTGNNAFGLNALGAVTTAANNSAFGTSALLVNTAAGNSAFGANALDANTSGTGNNAFGLNALGAVTTAANNSAFGTSALLVNTAVGNSAFGFQALDVNTTGTGNNAFGSNALGSVTTAANNSAFGTLALLSNTAAGNSAFGANALIVNTTGTGNNAFGFNALAAVTTNSNNSAFGSGVLELNNAPENSAFGALTLNKNTSGAQNSAFGFNALQGNTTGNFNNAFGANALYSNQTGDLSSAFGAFALFDNTASGNSAFGANSLNNNTIGTRNNAFGEGALSGNTTGINNNAFGFNALATVTTNGNNSAFGTLALEANTAAGNSAFGANALDANTSGTGNNAFGENALGANVTGNNNSAFGTSAGLLTTGGNNTLIGATSGINLTSGSNNIAIGAATTLADITGSNQLNIGNNIFGTGLNGTLAAPAGNIGIGTATPATTLDVAGTGNITGNTTLNTTTGGTTSFGNATGEDRIAIDPVANATPFTGTITSADLTAARTYTFPDASGTVVLDANVPNIYTANGTIAAATDRNITLGNRTTSKINIAPAGEAANISTLNVIGGDATDGRTLGITVSSNYTNSTNKFGIFKTPQFLNANPPVMGLAITNTATENLLTIGGNASDTQAAPSSIKFRVDADAVLTNDASLGVSIVPMTILGVSGNVGIGTETPTSRLHVSSTGNLPTVSNTTLLVSNTRGTGLAAFLTKTGLDIQSTNLWTGLQATNVGLNVNVSGGTINYAALFNGANVGIGTTTPATTLDVAGTGNITGNTTLNTTTGGTTSFGNATGEDRIAIDPVANATPFTGTITSADLTAARTYTFPDASGTVVLDANVPNIYTANGTIAAATDRNITLGDRTTSKINIAPTGEEPSISTLNVIGGTGGLSSGITIADNYINSTSKKGLLKTPQFLNANPPVMTLSTDTDATENILSVGGTNSPTHSSPSSIRFRVDGDTNLTNATTASNVIAMTILGVSGNVGIGTPTPNSTLHVSGANAYSFTTITGATPLDNTHRYIHATGPTLYLVGLPIASTCTGRVYTIRNNGASRNISNYTNLAGTVTASIANNTCITIISNGTTWLLVQ